jgi:hypothetical protein
VAGPGNGTVDEVVGTAVLAGGMVGDVVLGGDVAGAGSVVSTTVGGDDWADAGSRISSTPSEPEHAPRRLSALSARNERAARIVRSYGRPPRSRRAGRRNIAIAAPTATGSVGDECAGDAGERVVAGEERPLFGEHGYGWLGEGGHAQHGGVAGFDTADRHDR